MPMIQGIPKSGLVVYGWIQFQPEHWSSVFGMWLDARKRLWREYGIPVTRELHTTEHVNGRGRISTRVPECYRRGGKRCGRTSVATLPLNAWKP